MTLRQLAKLETIIARIEALQFDVARRNDEIAVWRLSVAKAELLKLLRERESVR